MSNGRDLKDDLDQLTHFINRLTILRLSYYYRDCAKAFPWTA